MSQVVALRKGLREVVKELEGTRDRLVGLRELGAGPPVAGGDADPEPLAEMCAVIECGLHDCLGPLIGDLQTAADYQARSPRCGQPLGEIDLSRSDEMTRQALYELVKKDNFFPGPPGAGDPDDRWVAPYTAEDARLEIFRLHARWFATWLKLEEPEALPEAERRELLVLAASEEHPGVLVYREV